MSTRDSTISLVVCTFNRCDILQENLRALQDQIVPKNLSIEIVVVDNNSSDRTREAVERLAGSSVWPIRYVFEPTQGLSYARNRGIQEASGEFVAFTDDDALPDRHWVQALHEAFIAHNAACVGGKILLDWSQPPPKWLERKQRLWTHLGFLDRGDNIHRVTVGEGGWIWGGNVAFRRSILDKVGLFRTDLGRQGRKLFIGEDGDIARRVALAGGTVIHQPKAIVYHRVGPERMRLPYFRRLRFYEGISRQRVRGNGSAHSSRIPRWLIRSCASHGVKALGAYTVGRTHRAIDEEMDFWTELGLIVGGLT